MTYTIVSRAVRISWQSLYENIILYHNYYILENISELGFWSQLYDDIKWYYTIV